MLAAYFDESGTHKDSKILVVAGMISPVSEWEKLTRAWERVLSEKGLSDFHTVDCAHREGAFKNWGREECSKLYIRLVNLTKRHVLWRSWSALIVEDYMQFAREEKRDKALYLAYSLCASICASRISSLATERNTRIPWVLERGGLGGKFAARAFSESIAAGRPSFSDIASVSFDTRQNLIPLQVADLHAYEVHKYFTDQMNETGRPVRRSFMEIMRIAEAGGGGHLFGANELRVVLQAFRNGIRSAETPVVPLNRSHLVRLPRVRS